MNASKKMTRFLSEKLLFTLFIGLLATIVGNQHVLANPGGSISPSELQQTVKKVEGVVKDKSGEPLIGVSVVIKGTNTGTLTDFDGRYSLNLNTANPTIVFSYVGFKAQSFVGNKSVINVVMEEDSKMMSEVVVIGYGVQKKENLTGAVSSVNVDEALGSRPIADVGRGLQGVVPGLSVVVPSGEVGSDPIMKIRGQVGSPNGNANPLILVDNVEIPSIQLLNPDDIESISILKDAASASIYGSKAAFGVILITTKRGAKTESMNVTYSNNFAFQNVAKKMEMAGLDGLEYALRSAERYGENIIGTFWRVDRASLAKAREWESLYGNSVGSNDPLVYNRDWYLQGTNRMGVRTYDPYEAMVREWAPTQTHNISVNGKSGKTAYNVGLGYIQQQGMMKPAQHDDFKRYNASLSLSTEVNKYVTLRASTIFSDRTKRYPVSGATQADPWYYMYRWSAISPIGDIEQNGVPLRGPVYETQNTLTGSIGNQYLNINMGATLNFTSNWDFKIDYTYAGTQDITSRAIHNFKAVDIWTMPLAQLDANGNQVFVDDAGQVVTEGGVPAYQFPTATYSPPGATSLLPYIYRSAANTTEGALNIYSTYNLKLGKENQHVFKFMSGLNRTTYSMKSHWTNKTDIVDENNPQFNLATGVITGGGDAQWNSQLGYFGRINYAFSDKYLLEANLRYDGSSKFPGHLKWRWFPSFSAGWIISNESFMKGLSPLLSFAKIRPSWGAIGDQSVRNDLYVPTMALYSTPWLSGDTRFQSFRTPPAVASDIKWQSVETLNLGVDLRFLNDMVGASFDWFQRDTKNMIVDGDVFPATYGTSSPKGNYGNLRTKGWEISLDFNKRFKNGLSINGLFTLADATTIITKGSDYLTPEGDRGIGTYSTGMRYGDIYGYETDRLYQKEDFVYDDAGNIRKIWVVIKGIAKETNMLAGENPNYQAELESGRFYFGPGDVKYKDLNGDGYINGGLGTRGDMGDRTVIGNSTPRFQYGFRLGADYKGFDFAVFFQGVGQRKVRGVGQLAIPGYRVSEGAMPQTFASDYWTPENTGAFYPAPTNIGENDDIFNMKVQSRYLLNMAYLRMQNLTFGYSLPGNALKKVLMTKARIYVSLENFLTFDKLKGLPIDPEAISGFSMFNDGNYGLGRTGTGIPTFKTASVGVQITF